MWSTTKSFNIINSQWKGQLHEIVLTGGLDEVGSSNQETKNEGNSQSQVCNNKQIIYIAALSSSSFGKEGVAGSSRSEGIAAQSDPVDVCRKLHGCRAI